MSLDLYNFLECDNDDRNQVFTARLKTEIEKNMGNASLSVRGLSEALGMSTSQMANKIRELYGSSPAKLICQARMEYACTLLHDITLPIKLITERVGFVHQTNFGRVFKKNYGVSPTVFRSRQIQKKGEYYALFKSPIKVKDKEYLENICSENPWIDKVVKEILSNFKDSKFDVKSLAGMLSISCSQLNRKLKTTLNISTSHLIRALRIQYAAELLEFKDLNIGDIAFESGFYDHAHFCKAFKETFHCTPNVFRKNQRKIGG